MSLGPQPPLPAPPILTPPRGWLGLLGIKSGGVQPQITNAVLQPTLEMFPFYRSGGRVGLCGTGVQPMTQNAFTTFAGQATVPAGHAWIIESVTAFIAALGVAAGARIAIVAGTPNMGFIFYGCPMQGPFVTGEAPSVSLPRLETPLILGPGEQLAVHCSAPAPLTAVNVSLQAFGVDVLT